MKCRVVAAALLIALLLCASVSWGAIGVYKWTADDEWDATDPTIPTPRDGSPVPAPISYMLNTDANSTVDGWSVKVEIRPVNGDDSLGAAIRTMTLAWDPAKTAAEQANGLRKGMNKNAFVWDGKDDGGATAPIGSYRAVITAKAAPITGTTVVPLWESDDVSVVSGKWMDIAISTNPASVYFGYMYAVSYGTTTTPAGSTPKGVYMFRPDGSFVKKFDEAGLTWGGSAPFGIAISADDHLWVGSYSDRAVVEFDATGTRLTGFIIVGNWQYGGSDILVRTPMVTGTGESFKAVCMQYSPSQSNPTNCKIASTSGTQPPPNGWPKVTSPVTAPLMQGQFDADGNIQFPAYSDNLSTLGGSLLKMTMDGSTILAQNGAVRRGTGLAITPDGYYYVARFVSTTTDTANACYDADGTAIYKIPASRVFASDFSDADITKLSIQCNAAAKRAQSLDPDAVGNIAASAGNSNFYANANTVGLYAAPDAGSENSRVTNRIYWGGNHLPTYDGDNGPVSVSSCAQGASVLVRVNVADLDGYLDIWRPSYAAAGAYLDRSAWGQSIVPMNAISHNTTTAVYELTISASGARPGTYQLPVYVRDSHYVTGEEQCVGHVAVTVTGGWISGTVTNVVTGWAIPNASVTADDGVNPVYTTTSDAAGAYTLSVAPGAYNVTAQRNGYAGSDDEASGGVNDTVGPAVQATVDCGVAAADVNPTLAPLRVRDCTMGNALTAVGRPVGETVCVRGYVLRAAQDTAGGVANGLNGYYYIYDTRWSGTSQACKIVLYTGQATLHEGDSVVIEGTWDIPYTFKQGRVTPSKAPYVVGPTTKRGAPVQLQYSSQLQYTYGYFVKYSGPVTEAQADRFSITLPRSSTNSTMETVWFRADTPATTGVAFPTTAGQLVEAVGIVSNIDAWSSANAFVAGKPADISPWQTVDSLAAATGLPSGSGVIIDATSQTDNPMIMTYKDGGELGGDTDRWFYVESKDRTAGLKVNTMKTSTNSYMPPFIDPGAHITLMKGRLVLPESSARPGEIDVPRELELIETPTTDMGDVSEIPAFISTNVRNFGGKTGTLAYIQGVGPSTEGLLMNVSGKASGYGTDGTWEWFYLDDGSGVPNENGYTGIKVVRTVKLTDPIFPPTAFPQTDGAIVSASGICTSKWVSGVGRVRILHMRFDPINFMVRDALTVLVAP